MSQEKHTPTPWDLSGDSSAYMEGTIISKGHIEVAGVWKKEDAELIVRAVNSYAARQETIRELLKIFEAVVREIEKAESMDCFITYEEAEKVITKTKEQYGL